ncbi:MAG TPA: FecR domain-containing protein [Acidiferrobacterales bacterium]|nr:FecR domain-containing protein [Acidiferrobacterales bacterium]
MIICVHLWLTAFSRFMRFLGFCLLLLTPMAATAGIGVFADVQGDTHILRGEVYLAAAPGVDVEEDDIIETGSKAGAQVEMNDGSLLKLGAASRLLLADYKLDSSGKVVNAGLEVLSGWLRFAVSKLRSKESRYAINTPTMTIGIRGTEGVIEAQTARGGLLLDEGEVAVHAVDAGSVPVRAGEYIERASGQPFVRPRTVPSAFRSRMPLVMQARMERRALLLKRRGVRAQQIRHIQHEDRARYIRQHPHLRERLEQRFRGHTGSNTEPRVKLRERRQQQTQQNHDQPARRSRPAGAAANRP